MNPGRLIGLLLLTYSQLIGQNQIWTNGHAHNDYYHERPLFEAIHFGFNSVEVDVWLRHDTLFVAHDSVEISPRLRLDNLYLFPLTELVKANAGWVLRENQPFILLIDIKSDSLQTYLAIDRILSSGDSIFTVYHRSGQVRQKAIDVVISGNRPKQFMRQQEMRRATYDGRLSDLKTTDSLSLMWLISDNASLYFHWRGEGDFPPGDLDFFFQTTDAVHQLGRKLRFWGLWDRPGEAREHQWRLLSSAGVDLISTDDLSGFDHWNRSR